jgi:hypothetical protein
LFLGNYLVTLKVYDPEGQFDISTITIQVGQPPIVQILSPPENQTFYVGQVLQLGGVATSSNGSIIPDTGLSWEVQQHHASHFHPFLDSTAGNNIEISPAPEPEDFMAATNSYLLVILTATDEDGLSTRVERKVYPINVTVKVETIPKGLTVLLDEFPVETPDNVMSWQNHNLRLKVENQSNYIFQYWNISTNATKMKNRTGKIVVPDPKVANLTITAHFINPDDIAPVPVPTAKAPVTAPVSKPVTKPVTTTTVAPIGSIATADDTPSTNTTPIATTNGSSSSNNIVSVVHSFLFTCPLLVLSWLLL